MILFEISCQFCHLENNSAAAAARLANLGRRDYSSLICPLFASAVRRPLMTPSSPKCHLCSVSALSTQFSDSFASRLYGVSSVSAVNNRLSGWHRSTTTPVFTLQPGMAPHHSVQTIPRCGRSPLCCVGIIALFCNHCQQISIQSEFLWKIKTAARLRNTRFNID